MPPRLTAEELEALGRVSTPALSNAIETFDVRPHNEGFAGPEIRAVFPELGTDGGVRVHAADRRRPTGAGRRRRRAARVLVVRRGQPRAPKVVVVQDLDPEPVGAFWGEVNANVHTGLGAVGTVTHGGVRDLDEMRRAGFRVFASAVLVSHAYVHVVDFGGPVQIGRLTVSPGDLIRADQHGVLGDAAGDRAGAVPGRLRDRASRARDHRAAPAAPRSRPSGWRRSGPAPCRAGRRRGGGAAPRRSSRDGRGPDVPAGRLRRRCAT